MKKCIILANGKPPRKSIITFFNKRGFEHLFCADGGAETASRMNLIPDAVIGDFDSVSPQTLKKIENKSKIIRLKRQNDTDVEKCLKYAINKNFDEVLLTGVTGNRLDHTICNLGIVLKFLNQIRITLVAEDSFLKPYKGEVELKSCKGETLSIYGFDRITKITSDGLKYELKNVSLPFGEKESTSNVAQKNVVQLKIRNGVVFVIRDVNFMIKNDLL